MSGHLTHASASWRLPTAAGQLLIVCLGVWLQAATLAQEETRREPRVRPMPASDVQEVNIKRIEQRLDEILKAQESILATYDELLEALRIVKVRVSR